MHINKNMILQVLTVALEISGWNYKRVGQKFKLKITAGEE